MFQHGDRIQQVLWRIKFGFLPVNVDIVTIHAGTNNLSKHKPVEVAEGNLQVGYAIKQRLPNSKIALTGLLPRGLKDSRFRNDIDSVNNYLGEILETVSFT